MAWACSPQASSPQASPTWARRAAWGRVSAQPGRVSASSASPAGKPSAACREFPGPVEHGGRGAAHASPERRQAWGRAWVPHRRALPMLEQTHRQNWPASSGRIQPWAWGQPFLLPTCLRPSSHPTWSHRNQDDPGDDAPREPRWSTMPTERTPPCPSGLREPACFRVRALLRARRHGPWPLLSFRSVPAGADRLVVEHAHSCLLIEWS